MGAFVSIPECKSHYNVTLDCSVMDDHSHQIVFNGTWPVNVSIGGYTKGQFPGDPDIAGVGILGVFIAVTSFALAASIAAVLWQMAKTFKWKSQKKVEDKRRISFTDILEALVMACSDQQLFTGAAYALTLRYLRGCTVSAYHYNIIANMLLLTCATHMMSVIIVRNYWRYPWLAILRILAISGVFIVTGLLFTNQNAADKRFPTGVPDADQSDSLIFLPAACFQSSKNTATATFQDSVRNPNAFFVQTIGHSTPDNKIQGWNIYVITLLYYGAALIAESVRFIRRARGRPGWRGNLAKRVGRTCAMGTVQRKVVSGVFLLYLFGGVAISSVDVVLAGSYIFNLRDWVNKSGWIQTINDENPENDATSFGQLVPILTSSLVLFSFFQIISEKVTRYSTYKHRDEETPGLGETIQYLDPSNYDLLSPPAKPGEEKVTTTTSTEYFGAAGVQAAAAASSNSKISSSSSPPRIELQHQDSWGTSISVPNVKPDAMKPSSPMLALDNTDAEAEEETGTDTDTAQRSKKGSSSSKSSNNSKKGSGYVALPTEPEPMQSRAGSPSIAIPRPSSRTPLGSKTGSPKPSKYGR